MDAQLEEASADLYAKPLTTFRRVTLALAMPAVLAGFLLAFTLSLDNTVVAAFVQVSGTTPWPVYVLSALRTGLRPEIAAVSTIMLLLTLVALALVALVLKRAGDSATQIARTMAAADARARHPDPSKEYAMTYADLVFTGGPVFTADTVRSRATAVAVTGGRIVAVGGDDVRDLDRPGDRGRRPGGADAAARVPGRPRAPGLGRPRACCAATWPSADTAGEYLEVDRATIAAQHPDDEWILGGGWQMSAFPGGTPTAAALDRVVAGPPGVLPQPRRARRVGQLRGAAPGGASTATPPIPPTAASSGTPTASRPERCTRARWRWSTGCCPRSRSSRLTEALLVGQRYLHSYGITAWQDAIVGRYGDAGDPGPAYLAPRPTAR